MNKPNIILKGKKRGIVSFKNMDDCVKVNITLYESQDMLMRAYLASKDGGLYRAGVLDASYPSAFIEKNLNLSALELEKIDAAFIVLYKFSFPIEVISAGFLNDEYDLKKFYFRAGISKADMPSFISAFGRDYGIEFKWCGYSEINLKSDALRYVFNSNGCKKSVLENGGFYYAKFENKAIVGIIGGERDLIFNDILSKPSFLAFSNQSTKSAFFIGVDFSINKIFPVFFKNRA